VDTTQKQKLAEEGGFRYEVATEEFADAIVAVLSESFSREPMSAALGLDARDLEPMVARFMPECTTNGLSVIAVPVDDPDTLAGVFINRDLGSPVPDGIPGDFPWFIPIVEALTAVGDAYVAKRPGLKLGDAVDLWMVGVQQGSRFARKGIASTLFRASAELARSRGFKRCVTECTGHYSQTAARRNGFQERARMAYRDFRFEGLAVFDEIEPPHTHVILFEREF
jgi:GNAT superfamily N-acetyltransferase